MNPSQPVRPDDFPGAPKPIPAGHTGSHEGIEGDEQLADVSSDRNVEGSPAKKGPLEINEIEDLEDDAEGG